MSVEQQGIPREEELLLKQDLYDALVSEFDKLGIDGSSALQTYSRIWSQCRLKAHQQARALDHNSRTQEQPATSGPSGEYQHGNTINDFSSFQLLHGPSRMWRQDLEDSEVYESAARLLTGAMSPVHVNTTPYFSHHVETPPSIPRAPMTTYADYSRRGNYPTQRSAHNTVARFPDGVAPFPRTEDVLDNEPTLEDFLEY